MKLFIDSADVKEIEDLAASGLVDGVTTNPTLIAKSGDAMKTLAKICELVPGSVSAEVLATDAAGMIKQGKRYSRIAKNITVKVPLTWDGLKACRALRDEGLMVNVTLCFSSVQAMMAAKAGATFVSPFVGRVDDVGGDGMELVREIRTLYDNYGFKTQILAASIRSVQHVRESALAGSDVATLPPEIFHKLLNHPLTDKGLATFLADAKKAGVTIPDD